MTIIGLDFLADLREQDHFVAKMVINEHGAIFFPVSEEHRDNKCDGISYEDDYRGNALAAMITPGRIEIRFHAEFSDARVRRIVDDLVRRDGLSALADWELVYQGRRLQ